MAPWFIFGAGALMGGVLVGLAAWFLRWREERRDIDRLAFLLAEPGGMDALRRGIEESKRRADEGLRRMRRS